MRKSIFDIASESINMSNETNRLISMTESEKLLCVNTNTYYKLFEFIDEYCFSDWDYRGHFIDVKDFLKSIDYNSLKTRATFRTDDFITLIELIYNLWYLSQKAFLNEKRGYKLQWCGNYYHLKDVMDDILDQYNQKAYIDGERVLIIEDKPEVTAVAEIVETNLALDVIRYNHRSLQGEVELKKQILISLGAELEPKRKELQTINKQLSEDIFFMLNNINIRHNNRSKKDKSKYKECVAKMSKKQLEKWYDELYQMMLLAILLLDNTDRTVKVKELKDKITGITT